MANDMVIAVTKAILGAGMKQAFYSGNTATANSGQRQPVHADTGQLWPNLEVATPPYSFVVNVPVVDMGPENGSTELWPGTHLDTSVTIQHGDIKVPAEKLEARRRVAPPLQPTVRAGSAVIRDIRLWHAGMPNRSNQHRPMIALIHNVSWWPIEPLRFPKGTESIFEHPDLKTLAKFVDDEIDYVHQSHAYEYTK
jgi:ectoine hydroxylase-related dioxygenase (phytanoyl-CoA dioxygenase family)